MITLYKDNVMQVKTEVFDGDLFVHMDIFLKNRKHIEEVCKELSEELLSIGVSEVFCMIDYDNESLKKFASYYGFVKDYVAEDTVYEVWVKEL